MQDFGAELGRLLESRTDAVAKALFLPHCATQLAQEPALNPPRIKHVRQGAQLA
jgi:hypothetical protein